MTNAFLCPSYSMSHYYFKPLLTPQIYAHTDDFLKIPNSESPSGNPGRARIKSLEVPRTASEALPEADYCNMENREHYSNNHGWSCEAHELFLEKFFYCFGGYSFPNSGWKVWKQKQFKS